MFRKAQWNALRMAGILLIAALQGCTCNQVQPAIVNERYGSHERNVLDFWQAESQTPTPVMVYIHGGGFTTGSKDQVGGALVAECIEAGISVAACSYRYATQAVYPGPLLDCARAVQYLRHNADRFNIDPDKMAAVGDSAGGITALWIGYQNNLADPESEDPVSRESTRLAAVGVFDAPCSLDPRYIRWLLGGRAYEHPSIPILFGAETQPCGLDAEALYPYYLNASPISHLSADDPPTFMYYSEPEEGLSGDPNSADCGSWETCHVCYPSYGQQLEGYPLPGEGIHHPWFGWALAEQLETQGIVHEYHHISDYGQSSPAAQVFKELVDFLLLHTSG